jgi:hypothetical protein
VDRSGTLIQATAEVEAFELTLKEDDLQEGLPK